MPAAARGEANGLLIPAFVLTCRLLGTSFADFVLTIMSADGSISRKRRNHSRKESLTMYFCKPKYNMMMCMHAEGSSPDSVDA